MNNMAGMMAPQNHWSKHSGHCLTDDFYHMVLKPLSTVVSWDMNRKKTKTASVYKNKNWNVNINNYEIRKGC